MSKKWSNLTKHEIYVWKNLIKESLQIEKVPVKLARSMWEEHIKNDPVEKPSKETIRKIAKESESKKKIKYFNKEYHRTVIEDVTKDYYSDIAKQII